MAVDIAEYIHCYVGYAIDYKCHSDFRSFWSLCVPAVICSSRVDVVSKVLRTCC